MAHNFKRKFCGNEGPAKKKPCDAGRGQNVQVQHLEIEHAPKTEEPSL
jgi:hypothetical protein